MRIEDLNMFASIAHYRSISETARREHFTQPAVSRTLTALEKQLGVKLVKRTERQRQPLELTTEGKILQRYASHIISDYQNMILDIAYKNVTQAKFTVSCGRSFSVLILPFLAERFKKTYPETGLVVKTSASTRDALNLLKHAGCDIVLSSVADNNPGLIYEKLMDDPLLLAAPLDMDIPDEITLRYMKRLPFIMRENTGITYSQIRTELAKHGVNIEDLDIRMVVHDNAVVQQAIAMGEGCGFVPRSALFNTQLRHQSVKLVKVRNCSINRSVFLVRREDRPLEGGLKLFWAYALTGKWYEDLFEYRPR